MVERHLAKVEVAGSSPVIRSIHGHENRARFSFKIKVLFLLSLILRPYGKRKDFLPRSELNTAPEPSGKAEVCKTFIPGPIPGGASKKKHICNADVLFSTKFACGE